MRAARHQLRPWTAARLGDSQIAGRLGADGRQGIRDEHRGSAVGLSLARASAKSGRLCDRLHRLFLDDYVGRRGVDGRGREIAEKNLGAGHPERARQGVHAHHASALPCRGCGFDVRFGSGSAVVAVRPTDPAAGDGETVQYPGEFRILLTLAMTTPVTAGHRRYAQPTLHHARVTDRRADRHVYGDPVDAPAAAGRHLAGHRPGSLHPLRPHRLPVPPGQMANHHRHSLVLPHVTVARSPVATTQSAWST